MKSKLFALESDNGKITVNDSNVILSDLEAENGVNPYRRYGIAS